MRNMIRRQVLQGSLALGIGTMMPLRLAAREAGTRLLLLGTQGGPNFLLERGETASALVVDGQPYLIDCGYGTLAALVEAGIRYREVGTIFLTHLHDDHVADLVALLGHQWTGGRIGPTEVYGPHGTQALVEATLAFQQANTEIRLVDEARSKLPKDLFSGEDVPATDTPHMIFEDERVTVSSIENTHYQDSSRGQMPHRSIAVRLDAANRSVTFSGDTNYSENLVKLARGCDVLVCEAMEVNAMRQAFERMVAEGSYADNPEGIWHHIVETHTSTEKAGQMAAEAGVTTLVLNHLIPGALQDLPDDAYVKGVRKHFDGEVIVGRDQMVI